MLVDSEQRMIWADQAEKKRIDYEDKRIEKLKNANLAKRVRCNFSFFAFRGFDNLPQRLKDGEAEEWELEGDELKKAVDNAHGDALIFGREDVELLIGKDGVIPNEYYIEAEDFHSNDEYKEYLKNHPQEIIKIKCWCFLSKDFGMINFCDEAPLLLIFQEPNILFSDQICVLAMDHSIIARGRVENLEPDIDGWDCDTEYLPDGCPDGY